MKRNPTHHRKFAHPTKAGHVVISGDPDGDVPNAMLQKALGGYVEKLSPADDDYVPTLATEYGIIDGHNVEYAKTPRNWAAITQDLPIVVTGKGRV